MTQVEAGTGLQAPTPTKTPSAAWHKTFPVRYGLQLGTSAMALVLWTVLAIGASETWLHFDIYSSLMSSVPLTGMIALSLTLVVIAREIDLSFGSVMAVGAWVFVSVGQPELGLLAGLAAGLGVGLLNGLIVVRFGIPSLVATIGTWFFWGGIVVWMTGGKGAGTEFANGFVQSLITGRSRHPGGVLLDGRDRDRALDPAQPAPLRRPRLPRRRQRAERPDDGLRSDRVRVSVFALVGMTAAFAGIASTLETNYFWPTVGSGAMLPTVPRSSSAGRRSSAAAARSSGRSSPRS